MLPSQSARSTSARSTMYRRGRGRQWLAVAVVVVLITGMIFAVRWLGGSGEPSSAGAGTPSATPGPVAKNQPEHRKTESANGQPKSNAGASVPQAHQPVQTPAVQPPAQSPPSQQPRISMGSPVNPAPPKADASNASPANPAPGSNPKPDPQPSFTAPPAAATTIIKTDNEQAAHADDAPAKPATPSNAGVTQRIDLGMQLLKQNKPVDARKMLSEALLTSGISSADAQRVREELTRLNERMVFSPEVVTGDPFVSSYQIQGGDALSRLPKKLGLSIDWRFLQRINKINDPARLQVGQRVKMIKGPFHAVVDKPAFRLDLYMGDASDRVYVMSVPVGLGEYGATPEGEFIVKTNSKLVDPAWTNPRTGEHFAANDPKNPLGEYWIGLVGISDNIRGLEGYGLHGTIEPDSIGQERSMGCVRMGADDIQLVYEVMIEGVSHVEIHGPDWP